MLPRCTALPTTTTTTQNNNYYYYRYTPDESRHWTFDDANIFAQIDAFVQRCRDLLEVCESQIQFSPRALAIRNAGGDVKAGTTACVA